MATRRKTDEEIFFLFHCLLTMGCEDVFLKGIPNNQLDTDSNPAIFKSSLNCKFEVDGKIAFVSPPEDQDARIRFLKESPTITPVGLKQAKDGVYTWILCKIKGGGDTIYFHARYVRSVLEVASLHLAIARAVQATTVHGAGELKKEGKKIVFNFQSGSYMKPDCAVKDREKYMRETYFSRIFGDYDIEFEAEGQTFITEKPTMEELQHYAGKGFRICLHEPDKIDECKSVKGTCENAIKPQEGAMRGGDDENLTVRGKAMPLTPRKAVSTIPRSPQKEQRLFGTTQAQEARRQLALRNAGVPEPVSHIEGMGRKRKTRRGKNAKRRMTKKKW